VRALGGSFSAVVSLEVSLVKKGREEWKVKCCIIFLRYFFRIFVYTVFFYNFYTDEDERDFFLLLCMDRAV
jgi:hypothetical protein